MAVPTSYFIGINGLQWMPAPNGTQFQANAAGSVNPDGLATTCYFKYDTSPTFSNNPVNTATQSIGSGTLPVTVTDTLTFLTPGQTYYVELVATNSSGTVNSAVTSFVASSAMGAPLTPTTVAQPTTEQQIVTPHLAWPFKLTNSGAVVNEQQSIQDTFAQVQLVANVQQGEIPELPTLGIPDFTFEQMPPDLASLTTLIQQQVPDATVQIVSTAMNDAGDDWQIAITTSSSATQST